MYNVEKMKKIINEADLIVEDYGFKINKHSIMVEKLSDTDKFCILTFNGYCSQSNMEETEIVLIENLFKENRKLLNLPQKDTEKAPFENFREKIEGWLKAECSSAWTVDRVDGSFACKWHNEIKMILQNDMGKWYITAYDVPADILLKVFDIAKTEDEKYIDEFMEEDMEHEDRI